jgi:hypothetical protein
MKTLAPVDFKAVAAKGCFVYCYLRSKDTATAKAGTPYYIGIAYAKNLNQRARRPFNKDHSCAVPGNPTLVRVLRSGLEHKESCRWERFYIAHYGHKLTGGILRNINGGGDGNYDPTGVIGAKIGEANRRRVFTPEMRANLGRAHKGKTISAEHREALSRALKGVPHSPEHNAKKSLALKGRPGQPLSAETRAKLSTARKGVAKSSEHKAKISAAHKGKPKSESAKEAMSAAAKARCERTLAELLSYLDDVSVADFRAMTSWGRSQTLKKAKAIKSVKKAA